MVCCLTSLHIHRIFITNYTKLRSTAIGMSANGTDILTNSHENWSNWVRSLSGQTHTASPSQRYTKIHAYAYAL